MALINVTPPGWDKYTDTKIARVIIYLRKLGFSAVMTSENGIYVEGGREITAVALRREIATATAFDPHPCPCGCGADLIVGNCDAVNHAEGFTEKEVFDVATLVKHNTFRGGGIIDIVRSVASRGIGIREAHRRVEALAWSLRNFDPTASNGLLYTEDMKHVERALAESTTALQRTTLLRIALFVAGRMDPSRAFALVYTYALYYREGANAWWR